MLFKGGGQADLPDTDNLLELVESESAAAAAKLRPHLPTLKVTPYADLVRQIGYDVAKDMSPAEIAKVGTLRTTHSAATTPRARSGVPPATLKCTSLFAGDGYTRTDAGTRGTREYLVKRLLCQRAARRQIVVLRP